ncbi:MAG: hypothetical protein ACREEK_36525 [Bradyrhizobium sp.]
MRKLATSLLFASTLFLGAVTAHSLYAQGNRQTFGAMGHGTRENGKVEGGMTGMMKRRGGMMDHCSNMMNDNRPNDQWRKDAPSELEKNK